MLYMIYYMFGGSRDIDMSSRQLQCCCWGQGCVETPFCLSPFLVYISLCMFYTKWTGLTKPHPLSGFWGLLVRKLLRMDGLAGYWIQPGLLQDVVFGE